MEIARESLEFEQAALESASRRLGLRRVVLFGSYATGEPAPDPDSDVDIAVSLAESRSRSAFWKVHDALGDVFAGRPLDLVFLDDADPLFRWEIVRDGVLLYGDLLDYLDYRAFAFRDFVDSADLRALERVLFDKKMAFIRRRLSAAA